jgi:hypothetical protein
MVKFFSEKTGLKYPYAKYAQTTVRDFGGGMENISATTQTDNMIHDARTELDANSDGLQAHELAISGSAITLPAGPGPTFGSTKGLQLTSRRCGTSTSSGTTTFSTQM